MNEYSYKQFSKSFVRRNALSYAVDILTSKRNESTCVPRDYVRRIFNFYTLKTLKHDYPNKSFLRAG